MCFHLITVPITQASLALRKVGNIKVEISMMGITIVIIIYHLERGDDAMQERHLPLIHRSVADINTPFATL